MSCDHRGTMKILRIICGFVFFLGGCVVIAVSGVIMGVVLAALGAFLLWPFQAAFLPRPFEAAMKILRIICGLAFLLGAFAMTAAGGVIPALVLALLGTLMLYPFIVAPVMNFFGNFFYSDSSQPAPEQYSLVHKLLQENQPDEAASELRRRLENYPADVNAAHLLMQTYYDHLNSPQEAVNVLRGELEKKNLQADHVRMVDLAVDILLEVKQQSDAVRILERAIEKLGCGGAVSPLRQRLDHMQ